MKLDVSPGFPIWGRNGTCSFFCESLYQSRVLNHLWFLMSALPFFRHPYLLVTSATNKCLTRLLAFLHYGTKNANKYGAFVEIFSYDLCLLVKVTWELDLALKNFLVDCHRVVIVEWVNTSVHLIDQNSQGPPVDRLSVTLVEEHFGGKILGRSTKRVGTSLTVLGEAEIGKLEVTLLVDENVFGLQIAVDDVQRVKVLKHERHLGAIEPTSR